MKAKSKFEELENDNLNDSTILYLNKNNNTWIEMQNHKAILSHDWDYGPVDGESMCKKCDAYYCYSNYPIKRFRLISGKLDKPSCYTKEELIVKEIIE